jgi:hypothetical protein
MPLTIVDGDVCVLKVACMAVDQLALNDYGFGLTTIVGTPTYEDLVTLLNTTIPTSYLSGMPSTAQYYGISLQRILPTKSQPITLADPAVGTAMGNLEPRQACGIISKKGTIPGRAGRGRVYVGFLADSITSSDGHLNAAGKLVLDAIGTELLTIQTRVPSVGTSVKMVPLIMNRLTPFYNYITTFQSRMRIATQKRRGDYGKQNTPPW